MPAYLQYIYVAMTTVGSEWHTLCNQQWACFVYYASFGRRGGQHCWRHHSTVTCQWWESWWTCTRRICFRRTRYVLLMHLSQYTTICHIEPPTYTDKPFVLVCSPYHQIMESIQCILKQTWVVECHTPFACGMYIHYTCVCASLCTRKSSFKCIPGIQLDKVCVGGAVP